MARAEGWRLLSQPHGDPNRRFGECRRHRGPGTPRTYIYPQVTRSFSNVTVTSPDAFVLVWLLPWITTREPSLPFRCTVFVLCSTSFLLFTAPPNQAVK